MTLDQDVGIGPETVETVALAAGSGDEKAKLAKALEKLNGHIAGTEAHAFMVLSA